MRPPAPDDPPHKSYTALPSCRKLTASENTADFPCGYETALPPAKAKQPLPAPPQDCEKTLLHRRQIARQMYKHTHQRKTERRQHQASNSAVFLLPDVRMIFYHVFIPLSVFLSSSIRTSHIFVYESPRIFSFSHFTRLLFTLMGTVNPHVFLLSLILHHFCREFAHLDTNPFPY